MLVDRDEKCIYNREITKMSYIKSYNEKYV